MVREKIVIVLMKWDLITNILIQEMFIQNMKEVLDHQLRQNLLIMHQVLEIIL